MLGISCTGSFISMTNNTLESFKARKVFSFEHYSLYEESKFYSQLSPGWKVLQLQPQGLAYHGHLALLMLKLFSPFLSYWSTKEGFQGTMHEPNHEILILVANAQRISNKHPY